MMEKFTKARVVVPTASYPVGEIVRGATAKALVEDGMAIPMYDPEPEPEKKDLGKAPENKSKKS